MGTTHRNTCRIIPEPHMRRYAVYFSHGDKIEVIAKNSSSARRKASSLLYEWCGYCTRTVRLEYEEIEEALNRRADKVRNLFIHLGKKKAE